MANKYDRWYKWLFSHPSFVERLIRSFVHEDFVREVDFTSVQRVDKEFVNDEFQERESDIIYQITYRDEPIYIFLLIEFQSTVDQSMPFRFCRYIAEFYEAFKKENSTSVFPAVFPLLLYTGNREWSVPVNMRELIEDAIPEKYIPSFEYYPVIINRIPKATLLRIRNAVSALFYVENTDSEQIENEFDTIIEILKEENIEAIRIFINWFHNFLESQSITIDEEIGEKIHTLEGVKAMFATVLERRDARMKEQGIEQGIERVAAKMLQRGKSIREVCEDTGLSEERVREIANTPK